MSTPDTPRKNPKPILITKGIVGLGLVVLSAWLLITGRDILLAAILAVAALFALIDAIDGWRKLNDS